MVYVTSDLHGYPLEKFLELLKKAEFSDDDYLFILGDVIDRGKDGARILEWLLYQPNVQLIRGNHETMMLKCDFAFTEITTDSIDALSDEGMRALRHWTRNGGGETLEGLYKLDKETLKDIVEYLREAPLYETVKVGDRSFVLTHSGLGNYRDGKPLPLYSEFDMIWHRPFLEDEYSSEFTTVFGHTPTWHYGDEFRGRMIKTRTWINIDTGVAFGLHPMLLRLDDMKEFYVE